LHETLDNRKTLCRQREESDQFIKPPQNQQQSTHPTKQHRQSHAAHQTKLLDLLAQKPTPTKHQKW